MKRKTKTIALPKKKNICGPRVRLARTRGKPPLSQQELSDRLVKGGFNISPTDIEKIETGQRMVRDYEMLLLAEALGVSRDWLFTGRQR